MKIILSIFFTLFAFFFSSTVFSSGGGAHGGGAGAEGGPAGNYKEITPPIVVNLPDPRQSRFMQISIAVSSPKPEVLAAMEAHHPLIRNNLIMLFASQEKEVVKTREGREKLRADAEEVVNKALKEVGSEPIEALYFTGLVVQ
ncbi:flagellar FliL protein [Gammaproteobacteria bacterium]